MLCYIYILADFNYDFKKKNTVKARGWDKFIRGEVGGIVMLASWEKHFIIICGNFSNKPNTNVCISSI